ncbi:MAG TPA: hypothetical protein VGI58_18735 [Streptosporangiaceae bacterium]
MATWLGSRPIRPYRAYLLLEAGTSFMLGIAYATITVYWVSSGHLNALELLLLGTVLELSYFLLQLPTGVLADLVSRRLCTLVGLFVIGLALVIAGLSPALPNLMAAQVVLGFGAALNNGAQEAWAAGELASEFGDDGITGVYLRATQYGLIATVAGSLLSGVIALAGLNVPLLVGGVLICLLALGTSVVMPETAFQPALAGQAGAELVLRQARTTLTRQVRSAHRAVIIVPGLVLLLAMTAFAGLWSESFDRLWGAFLLRDTTFPRFGGLHPAMWFSLFACAAAVLGLGATEIARRRTERLGPDSVVGGMLVITLAIGAAVVAMATAHAFAIAVGAYLAVSVLRPVLDPLISGWIVGRIDPGVRATVLSAKDMFDSAGQIIGGPVIGVVGTLASIRVALLAGAGALAPAAACIMAASRRIRPRQLRTVEAVGGPAATEVADAAEAAGVVLPSSNPSLPG